MGADSVCSNFSSHKTSQMHFAVSAAVTVAMNSASAELSAMSECVSDPHTVAPPECVSTHPGVNCHLPRSFAWAVSTKPISLSHAAIDSGCCLSMTSGGSNFTDSVSWL